MKTALSAITGLAVCALAALPACATPINFGQYYEFAFGGAPYVGVGCNNTGVANCTPTTNPVANVSNMSPWTFTGPASVYVLDLGDVGDMFQVFDNGSSLGTTSTVANTGLNPCGPKGSLNIACSAADPAYSQGTFTVGGGSNSLTIEEVQNALGTTGGQAVFRVDSVASTPEPNESWIMLLAGLAIGFVQYRRIRIRQRA